MLLLDVNVIVYALRSDSPAHRLAREWVTSAYAGNEPIALCPPVVAGVVRIATSRRIFASPTPSDTVWGWVSAARSSPLHRFVAAGPRHLDLLERLCRDAGAAGNLVSDAVLAALAIEHGCQLVSTDGDFARFEGLRWSRPWPADAVTG